MRPVGQWSRRPAGPAYLEFIFYFFISLGKHYIDSEIKDLCMHIVYTLYISVIRGPRLLSHDGRLTDHGPRIS